ncbi:hypothetical protein L0B53_10420 [Vibrio sp. SS-MA-C1-2]|uniref:hypothetical protein n=1 Tax=Vibrio sp. SS-MA-C1-2 TaxID=2908646 RepID=UPI001F47A4EF|nr:hypothetical protein [Vibrio sp. SS-MA-C1-2]UJF19860.1 hypothetical protein L0B53_10420 [Vibrio sp. SS-MA-C1-2]
MKKIAFTTLLISSLSTPAFADSIGGFLGTPMSGVQYKHNDLRFSVGLDDFGLAVDKVFNLGSLVNNQKLNPAYLFAGVQYVDQHHHKVGVRSGIGAQFPIESFELYAEIGPTLYVVEDVDIDVEGVLGVRYRF